MAQSALRNLFESFKTILVIIVILWIILAVSAVLPLDQFGIRPRTLIGLPGIVLAPFLHQGIAHLWGNTVILLVLGTVFLMMERKLSLFIVAQIVFFAGLGTWLIGRPHTVHIGASGVIYGILGYLLAMGFFNRNLAAIVVSILVFIGYGYAILGILPTSNGVSWEYHFCGFFSGILIARSYRRSR